MCKAAPIRVSYGDIEYSITTVEIEAENVSYIAARMVAANGRLVKPIYEHELSLRFKSVGGAKAAWKGGFKANDKLFLNRSIIERVLNHELGETVEDVPIPDTVSQLESTHHAAPTAK
jgi:hypothetical protein